MKRIGAVVGVLLAASMAITGCSYERSMTDDEIDAKLAAHYQEASDARWESLLLPTLSRPEVEIEAYIDPGETQEVYDACMEEAGYAGWRSSAFIALSGLPRDEIIAAFACESRYPARPADSVLGATTQVDVLYSYYRDSLVPCLTGAGLDVGGVPTRSNFAISISQGRQWTPYGHDVGVNDAESLVIRQNCGDLTAVIVGS